MLDNEKFDYSREQAIDVQQVKNIKLSSKLDKLKNTANAYLDNNLSWSAKKEFEEQMAAHPEIFKYVEDRKEQFLQIERMIPEAQASDDLFAQMSSEVKTLVHDFIDFDEPEKGLKSELSQKFKSLFKM